MSEEEILDSYIKKKYGIAAQYIDADERKQIADSITYAFYRSTVMIKEQSEEKKGAKQ